MAALNVVSRKGFVPAGEKIALDDMDRSILTLVQGGFPLDRRPYAAIGRACATTEEDAFSRIEHMRQTGDIRRVGAVFDARRLGYSSTLCAIAVPTATALERVASCVDSYDEVTHDYERSDHYNLWFTVIARDRGRIETILSDIKAKTGCDDIIDLPAVRMFKIRVDFDLVGDGGSRHGDESVSRKRPIASTYAVPTSSPGYTPEDQGLVRLAQGDVGGSLTPFDIISQRMNEQGWPLTPDEVIERLAVWAERGIVRRFGAVLRHRSLGFAYNAMTVWNILDSQADKAGSIMAREASVSHCYQRFRTGDWTYNMYAMIHGRTREECGECASRINDQLLRQGIGAGRPHLLYSTREFKKRSMRYFSEEEFLPSRTEGTE